MTSLKIRGGIVHVDGESRDADVLIDGSQITAVAVRDEAGAERSIDASGCSVLPGFVDLQVNGALGVDLTSQPGRIAEVAAYLVQCGVTSFMPTVISSSESTIGTAIEAIRQWSKEDQPGARSLGAHIEGPFLNPARAGAHPPQHLRLPSIAESQAWSYESGVGMVTIAPELPLALDVVEQLVAGGVTVCAGHTQATPADLQTAIAAGVRGVTHLFNAMGTMSARAPGPAGATLGDASLIAGLIVDGLHVDPAMVCLAWRALGPGRIALVTDAIAALGLPHGTYSVGDTSVVVDETGARTAGDVLAGSVLRFDEAVRNLIAFTGCALADASISASTTPARLIQRNDIGRLAAGCKADVAVLDDDNQVVVTVVSGRVVFDPQQRCTAS